MAQDASSILRQFYIKTKKVFVFVFVFVFFFVPSQPQLVPATACVSE